MNRYGNREVLLEQVLRFRRAIVRSNPRMNRLATLHEFPRGSCRDASLLLAKYLQVNQCAPCYFVLGERRGESHAWLELEEYIVDITADQFEDQDAAVIVSTDRSWHSSFNGKIHNIADFCLYDPASVFELTRAYETITSFLYD